MNPDKRRIYEIVEAAAQAVTDENGVFYQKALADEVKARLAAKELPPHLREHAADMGVAQLAAQFVRNRTPKKRDDGKLFDPCAILPLGGEDSAVKRVWMDKATDEDLMAWGAQDAANLSKVAAASAVKQAYIAERVREMRDHQIRTLGRLERDVHNWAEDDMPDDDEPDDEPF